VGEPQFLAAVPALAISDERRGGRVPAGRAGLHRADPRGPRYGNPAARCGRTPRLCGRRQRDQVLDGNVEDLDPRLLAPYLRWLTGEVRLLIDDLKERGIEFAEG
jgi:hypothetical protein